MEKLIQEKKSCWQKEMIYNRGMIQFYGEYGEFGLFRIYMVFNQEESILVLRQSRNAGKWFVQHSGKYPEDFENLSKDEAVTKWCQEYYHLVRKELEALAV